MLEISTILFPTDFSDCAQRALPAAIELALRHHAHLHMLHVIEPFPGAAEPVAPFPGETGAVSALETDASGERRVTHHIARSPAIGPTILDHVKDLEIDVIVMGSHGRRGIRRWLLGSVADEVLRHASCPVLLVTAETGAEFTGYGRVLALIDFSDTTETVVRHAEALALATGAALELFHVIETPIYPDFYVASLTLPETRRRALERLARIAGDVESGTEVAVEVVSGRVVDRVTAHAASHGHDVIVMASQGHSGLKRLVLGSTAEGVVRRALCPVLVLKAGGRELVDDAVETTGAASPT